MTIEYWRQRARAVEGRNDQLEKTIRQLKHGDDMASLMERMQDAERAVAVLERLVRELTDRVGTLEFHRKQPGDGFFIPPISMVTVEPKK